MQGRLTISLRTWARRSELASAKIAGGPSSYLSVLGGDPSGAAWNLTVVRQLSETS